MQSVFYVVFGFSGLIRKKPNKMKVFTQKQFCRNLKAIKPQILKMLTKYFY